ncbi:MAG: hypothetical protein HY822_19485 [Acidobacteria bacterium]|nr:hypothetical protein [Acidobacteriota bacterium]
MIAARPGKSQYSESEAAEALGVTVDEFRRLIRNHIVRGEDDLGHLSQTQFQPADLLLLKFLSAPPA